MTFPNDANGELLALMQGEGIDLAQAYMLDFYVLFGSEKQGQLAVDGVRSQFPHAALFLNHSEETGQWELRLQQEMVPDYDAINGVEAKLAEQCRPFKGKLDGWGMLEPEDELDDEDE
ncbi:ribonuclease E inhibitor RraB [Ferrimonas marina]|uniref:Regulator of ribonuclease activity B n=1 Tax=Ferrimonas marina TaxID=299255 RepID=A0A1M5XCA4_9GAMM|nr:ribonuclease E inhibitor RraB [Ferrimonas marina]SHH97406.1 Regulator of ribonuclease activity B [Ferrimonas marina]